MDLLRSGYRAKMKTVQSLPPAEVVWFKVDDNTPAFGKTTAFRSRNYRSDPTNSGIGEQSEGLICCGKRDVTYYKGNKPTGFVGGLVPCGTDAVAITGAGVGDPVFATLSNGSAPCCAGPPSFTGLVFTQLLIDGNMRANGDWPLTAGFNTSWFVLEDAIPVIRRFLQAGIHSQISFGRFGCPTAFIEFTSPPSGSRVTMDFPPLSTTNHRIIWWGRRTLRYQVHFPSVNQTLTFQMNWITSGV